MKQLCYATVGFFLFFFNVLFGATLTKAPSGGQKYHPLEFHLDSDHNFDNPFIDVNVYADFTSPTGESFRVGGFYDGDGTWKIRFKPNRTGEWSMRWFFDNESGMHSFTCNNNSHPNIHGHIYVDEDHPRKFRYEDGTPLFWHGGKYLSIEKPFGSADKQELSYPERLPTDDYVEYAKQYLRDIAKRGLNGVLFKIQVLPLNYDGFTMDLDFLNALDEITFEALEQGVNMQMNLFDPWGKRKQDVDWAQSIPDNADQLFLEPWNVYSYVDETTFYLEYIVARYAAFPNVTWEMFNEAEKLDVSANTPTDVYRDIIRAVDPYDVLIGSSEMYTCWYGQDAAYAHMKSKCWPDEWDFMYWAVNNDRRYQPYYFQHDLPFIWNEIGPWEGDDYSEADRQDWFRAQFWNALTLGSAGISEDHWTDIRTVPDRITDYHQYFIRFVDNLVDMTRLEPNDYWATNVSFGATLHMCQNDWNEMVIHIYTQEDASETTFDLFLKEGRYFYQYYDPKTGRWLDVAHIREASRDKYKTFTTPVYDQDIVLYIVDEQFGQPAKPVEWTALSAKQQGDKIVLDWQTASESNNLGFEISRRTEKSTFEKIGRIPGAGTTTEPQRYSFSDMPPASDDYTYRIRQLDTDGTLQDRMVAVHYVQLESSASSVFPNPGRGLTTIQFQLPAAQSPLTMKIYNSLGKEVRSIDVAAASSGMQSAHWDGRNAFGGTVAAGVYFYTICAKNEPLRILHSGHILRIK